MRCILALVVLPALFISNSHAQDGASAQCMALVEQGKPAEAEPFCAKAERESTEGMLMYADFLFRGGDHKGAIQRYTAILALADSANLRPVELMALGHRAIARLNSYKSEDARRDVEAYLAVRPNDVELLALLVQYAQLNADRVEYARRLVAAKPGEMEFNLMLVDALIRDGKGADAVAAAEAAMQLDASSGIAQTWRGYAHGAAGDHVKAERDHAAVARRLPKEPDPRANLANSLMEQQRYPEAIAAAGEALKLKPDHYDALAIRAEARLRMGDGHGALEDHRSAQRVSTSKVFTNFEERATQVIATHEAMTEGSLARLESDRLAVLEAVANDLHRVCGNYQVPDHEDNENLDAYRDCTLAWSKGRQGIAKNLTPEAMTTVERFYGNRRWIESALSLRCSTMPRKSRCVDDSAIARAQAAFAGMDNPTVLIGNAEWDRLNREVDVYNARLSRQNAVNKYVSFMQALSDALAEQSSQ
jgi:tetratricopeptide (TPR) repeat protein